MLLILHEKNKCFSTYFDVHDLGDFPQVNEKANEDADLHHKVGFVVQNVQQHH